MTDWNKLRQQKELIKMREQAMHNWREALMEEGDHPFVDVMPNAETKKASKKKEEKKEEEVEEKEEGRKELDLKKERKL